MSSEVFVGRENGTSQARQDRTTQARPDESQRKTLNHQAKLETRGRQTGQRISLIGILFKQTKKHVPLDQGLCLLPARRGVLDTFHDTGLKQVPLKASRPDPHEGVLQISNLPVTVAFGTDLGPSPDRPALLEGKRGRIFGYLLQLADC